MATQDKFELMLEMQLTLQKDRMKDGDPQKLGGDAMAEFMTWNAYALEDEIHEAMSEVGWKPWASARFVNQPQFNQEMVDAFHFFMNMLLAANPDRTPAQIADDFTTLYIAKNAVNAQRQVEGYTGLNKCRECHRDLMEVDQLGIVSDEVGDKFCNMDHRAAYLEKVTR